MHIKIDPGSGVPIYLQIIQEIRLLVAGGVISHGDKLPSVRNMAVMLRVNPNTVSKAYNEMERDGLIVTRRGEGTFVNDDNDDAKESQGVSILLEKLGEIIRMADKFAVSRKKLHRLMDEAAENNERIKE